MKASKGYYALIQYCPDLSRLEAANIGVILFCPERGFIRARTAQSNDRIRRFFGSTDNDWTQINAVKSAVEKRLEVAASHFQNLEDFNQFIATRANEIQVSPPRPMKVVDPEKDLQELFDQLVGGRAHRESKDFAAPVKKALSRAFATEKVEPYIQKNVTVTVPVFHRSLTVPFAYRNGRFNLIQPVRFQQTTEVGVVGTACRYAVEGRSLYRNPDRGLGDLKLVVVGAFAKEATVYADVVKDILGENEVSLFTVENLRGLIEEIRTTAKVQLALDTRSK